MTARYTLLFNVTTNPTNLSAAPGRSGGWSESHWAPPSTPPLPFFQNLAALRAPMLPSECAIIGWRYQNYTIQGNKLLPLGSTTGGFIYPGGYANDLNLPQDGLTLAASSSAAPNATRFTLRGLPDSQISNGEYQPSTAFSNLLQTYTNYLTGVSNWGFIGRTKTNPSARVVSIGGGIITLNGPIGGVGGTDFIRLNRVYDVSGDPVKGVFPITLIAGNLYTVSGLAGVTATMPSGTARIDGLTYFQYSTITPQRAVSRKIGRPSYQYRGRRSRQRAV